MTISDNHFTILGITRHSTAAEIKKAYYRQIKKWHPDKFQNQPEKLSEAIERSKQINDAFELLKTYIPPPKNTKFKDSKSASKSTGKPEFHRVKINSSNIWTIGYDAFTRILEVEFLDGKIYHYYEVPENAYTKLMFADPVSRYLSTHIITKYRSEHIR